MDAPVATPPAGLPPAQPGQQVTYYVYQMQAPAAGGAGGESMKVDWSTCFTFYFLRAALNFFNLAAWVILIAGAAQNQHTCNKGEFPTPFPGLTTGSTAGFNVGDAKDCVYFFALLWWAVWLQFTTVVVATITTFSLFSKYRYVKSIFTTTMYFFLMSSVLLFFIADTYSNATYIAENKAPVSKSWTAGVTLVTVGAICSLVFNFIWIMWNSYADVPVFPGAPTGAPPAMDGDAYIAPHPVETKA